MTVKIMNMEMPKSCKVCRFAVSDEDDILFCHAEGRPVTFAEERYVFKNKPSWCPLQEVKE